MLTTSLHAPARWRQIRERSRIRKVRSLLPASRVLLLAAASLLPAPRAVMADSINGAWQQLPPPPPPTAPLPGRTSFVMVLDTSRDRLIVFGGDPGPSNDVWAFPLGVAGLGWSQLATAGTPPSGRYGAAAIYDPAGDRLIVYGGYSSGWPGDLWQLTLAGTPTWTQLSPGGQMPPARQDPSAFYDPVGQQMVVFGGASGSGFMNDAWTLALNGRVRWSRLNPSGTPPSGRDVAPTAYDSARQRMVVFGGWDGSSYLDDTWALALSRGRPSWSRISTANAPSGRREGHAIYDAAGDRVVLFGGVGLGPPPSNYEYRNDTWQLSFAGTPNWSQLAPTGAIPSARGNGRAALDASRQRMLLVGGYDGEYRGDVEALSLTGPPSWTQVLGDSAAAVIEAHRDYAAVYDPDDRAELMFGGTEYYADIDETWRLPLDGTTAAWERLAVTPAPSPRHGHRGVWDPLRHRMLVFGGYSAYDAFGFLNDVWSLTPSPSPSWVALAPQGTPPIKRMLCGLGYDPVRDRLIVVGGHGGFTSGNPPYMNDVWALSLAGPTMQWSQLAVAGIPPSPRWIYGMRYDPLRDRFVFFGGVTALGRPNDAWALNLAGSPSWSLLTPAGTPPSGRSDHAMIYDSANDRMVVFGGYDGAFRNDVWALDLAGSMTWVQLSPTGGPPVGRDIIDAIYDPVLGRLIVYGGWNGSDFLNDTWALTFGPPAGGEGAASAVTLGAVPAYALELAGAQPNPAVRELWVALTLPRGDAARLELLDVSGRLVAARDVGALGAGRHRVRLGEDVQLAPGLYVIRLKSGDRAVTRKALLVR